MLLSVLNANNRYMKGALYCNSSSSNYSLHFHTFRWVRDTKLVLKGDVRRFNPQIYLLDNVSSFISLKSSGSVRFAGSRTRMIFVQVLFLTCSCFNLEKDSVANISDPNQAKNSIPQQDCWRFRRVFSWVTSIRGRAVAQWLDAGFPPWRPGFAYGQHLGFVVDEAAMGQVFSEYFGFPCQSFHRFLHYHNHPGLTP
jgi:hypothetical protein